MATIFSRIIQGEIPSYTLYEDEYTFAFLDIAPLAPGHTLIIPKIEVDKFYDVPEPYYSAVFQTAKLLAPAMEKALSVERVIAKIIGTDVPHFHLHLQPLTPGYSGKTLSMTAEQFQLTATKIREALR